MSVDVETFILSARFGLIHATVPLPLYDHRLTSKQQQVLSERVGPELKQLADADRFSDAFICAGRDYLDVLDPYLDQLRAAVPVAIAAGGIGEKLTRLTGWLSGPRHLAPFRKSQVIKVRGIEITASYDEVLAIARDALKSGDAYARRCHGWYVPVDCGRIAPKWLIHKLTSLPFGRFHSDDARRALAALGIDVLPCN